MLAWLERECGPERILTMTQLSDSQVYIVNCWDRKLEVVRLSIIFIHGRNSERRLSLDDLLISPEYWWDGFVWYCAIVISWSHKFSHLTK